MVQQLLRCPLWPPLRFNSRAQKNDAPTPFRHCCRIFAPPIPRLVRWSRCPLRMPIAERGSRYNAFGAVSPYVEPDPRRCRTRCRTWGHHENIGVPEKFRSRFRFMERPACPCRCMRCGSVSQYSVPGLPPCSPGFVGSADKLPCRAIDLFHASVAANRLKVGNTTVAYTIKAEPRVMFPQSAFRATVTTRLISFRSTLDPRHATGTVVCGACPRHAGTQPGRLLDNSIAPQFNLRKECLCTNLPKKLSAISEP
jgi:hypothetical protein